MRITGFLLLQIVFQAPLSVFAQGKKPVIAFTSDTQEPMRVEKLFRKTNHNLQATRLIFGDVDRLHPSAFFILGDVISLGKSSKAWKNIDRYIRQTTHDSIHVYATLGNHEVMINAKKGTRFFCVCFFLFVFVFY